MHKMPINIRTSGRRVGVGNGVSLVRQLIDLLGVNMGLLHAGILSLILVKG